jgi:sulfite reductase (NADPH) flavoprotein alpha-component
MHATMSAQVASQPRSPLAEDRNVLLARLVDGLDSPTLWWISGYSAGLAERAADTRSSAAPVAVPGISAQAVSVVYASQTGNARRTAEKLSAELEAAGIAVRLFNASVYPLRQLKSERLLYLVVSTQGDGDPPDDGRAFVEHLLGPRAPKLPNLRYGVLGLGDSSYPQFNAIGRTLDGRLEQLGAERAIALGEADLDIDSVATPWRQLALEPAAVFQGRQPRMLRCAPAWWPCIPPANLRRYSRENPFAAELLSNQRITSRDSDNVVRHIELSLAGSGLDYAPGDALGIWPTNDPALVNEILEHLQLDGATQVTHEVENLSLHAWLATRRELTRVSRPLLASLAAASGNAELNRLLAGEQREELAKLLASHQFIDLLRLYPTAWDAHELIAALRPLTPRLYSIASSRKQVEDEVHLTVANVAWQAFGRSRGGAASSYLARAKPRDRLPVFIEANDRFRLPVDGSRDIIMIGAGTGVAPYRAFLQERAETSAAGRNWLVIRQPAFAQRFPLPDRMATGPARGPPEPSRPRLFA